MSDDVEVLIDQIRSGDQEIMDAAAKILCRTKNRKAIHPLINITFHGDSVVRGIGALCLGVQGDKRGVKALKRLKRVDVDKNVRLAAHLALKYFGKRTYEDLKSELRTYDAFPEDEIFPRKSRPAGGRVRPGFLSRIPIVGQFTVYSWQRQTAIISAGVFILLLLILLVIPRKQIFTIRTDEIVEPKTKQSFGRLLLDRNMQITEFKEKRLNPAMPESKLPQTMSLTTYGDELKELTDKVYDAPQFSKAGKNTLVASWRKMNYKTTRRDREDSLLYDLSSGEQLIFPNPSAMHMEYDLEKGSIAYEAIEKEDPDLEIVVIVEKVTVK